MSGNNNLVLGIALLGGAYLYSRNKAAVILPTTRPTGPVALGAGSMPATAGTGLAQVLGGLLGNLNAPQSGGGTQTGAPVTNPFANTYGGDPVLGNTADSVTTSPTPFDPSSGSSVLDSLSDPFEGYA